jgi:hypothetical protein
MLVAFNIATLIIGSMFMADAWAGAKGFNPDTWGEFAYSFEAEMWAALMIVGSVLCLIGLAKPVRYWMVAVGAFSQFFQFFAIAWSVFYTGGEFVVGIYASTLFIPLYLWKLYEAVRGSVK